MKFSTFPAELREATPLGACNRWLQWQSMRIELPSTSWADTVHRAEDDAHTLTVAAQTASDWAPLQLLPDPPGAPCARAEVQCGEPLVLTITL